MKRIELTGGGTAGHVTPNIALLPALRSAGYEISYIGSMEGIEKKLIECEEEGIKLPIPAAMLANMYAGGGMSVIIWWLENGMPCTIDELVGFLSTLISQPTEL